MAVEEAANEVKKKTAVQLKKEAAKAEKLAKFREKEKRMAEKKLQMANKAGEVCYEFLIKKYFTNIRTDTPLCVDFH